MVLNALKEGLASAGYLCRKVCKAQKLARQFQMQISVWGQTVANLNCEGLHFLPNLCQDRRFRGAGIPALAELSRVLDTVWNYQIYLMSRTLPDSTSLWQWAEIGSVISCRRVSTVFNPQQIEGSEFKGKIIWWCNKRPLPFLLCWISFYGVMWVFLAEFSSRDFPTVYVYSWKSKSHKEKI